MDSDGRHGRPVHISELAFSTFVLLPELLSCHWDSKKSYQTSKVRQSRTPAKISATLVRVTDFSCGDEGEERRGVVVGGRLLAEREQWEWGAS